MIANDLAVLLTLYLRRLVTVAVKVRESCLDAPSTEGTMWVDYPCPVFGPLTASYWHQHPAVLVYGSKGVERVIDYNPGPKGIDAGELCAWLSQTAAVPDLDGFLRSARAYAEAMEVIGSNPQLAYLMLITSVEAIACSTLHDYTPSVEDRIQAKQGVVRTAIAFGLSDAQAKELALKATEGDRWVAAKFVGFLMEYANPSAWAEDDLFRIPVLGVPESDSFEKALRSIYRTRSRATHSGAPFPGTASLGTTRLVDDAALFQVFGDEAMFPPVVWFERVVNEALRNYAARTASATPLGDGV